MPKKSKKSRFRGVPYKNKSSTEDRSKAFGAELDIITTNQTAIIDQPEETLVKQTASDTVAKFRLLRKKPLCPNQK